MSLRELIEPDCVGVNPLMRIRGHIIHDNARKDDGINAGQGFIQNYGPMSTEANQFINEFNQQMQPNSFHMDAILQNMNGGGQQFQQQAPVHIEEIGVGNEWANDFRQENAKVIVGKPIDDLATASGSSRNQWSNEFNMPGPSQRVNQTFLNR